MMQLERWSLLIIRESMLRGLTRFSDFQMSLGVAPDLLAIRLDELVSAGILEVSPTSDYVLTPKGWDLEPTISALSSWSEKWTDATPPGRALRTTAAWPITRTPVIPSPHDLPVDDIVLPGTVETTAEATEEAARPAATTGPLGGIPAPTRVPRPQRPPRRPGRDGRKDVARGFQRTRGHQPALGTVPTRRADP
jgi:DNA-binding HxlR family transcriptional regulator